MKPIYILSLTALIFWGCSDNFTSETEIETKSQPLGKWNVEGVSQKGPFVTGSTVNVLELEGNSLIQTGKIFKSSIKSDKGDFSIEGNELASQYALLEVNGYYRNEITGKKSSGPLTLNAITDLSNREIVNVNLLTHLEYERVKKLVSEGKSVTDAKAQADREILTTMAMNESSDAFEDLDIFKSGEGNAKLLAISILLQGDEDVAGLTERLGKFAMELAENGSWNDQATRTAVAYWACEMDQRNMYGTVKENILGWGFSDSLPDFEKNISMFWADNYGLGKCSNSNMGDTTQNMNPLSKRTGEQFVCNGVRWESTNKNSSNYKGVYGTLTDERDGHTYKTVQIGEQVWMAENLNYDYQTEITHSLCHENKQENCDAYGRLYPFAAAVDSAGLFGNGGLGCGGNGFVASPAANLTESSRGVCPEGWHLPSRGEWEQLIETVGGEDVAANALIAADDFSSDEYGFNSYSAGFYAYGSGFLDYVGSNSATYWTSTPYEMELAGGLFKTTRIEIEPDAVSFQIHDLGYSFAVRCVMD